MKNNKLCILLVDLDGKMMDKIFENKIFFEKVIWSDFNYAIERTITDRTFDGNEYDGILIFDDLKQLRYSYIFIIKAWMEVHPTCHWMYMPKEFFNHDGLQKAIDYFEQQKGKRSGTNVWLG